MPLSESIKALKNVNMKLIEQQVFNKLYDAGKLREMVDVLIGEIGEQGYQSTFSQKDGRGIVDPKVAIDQYVPGVFGDKEKYSAEVMTRFQASPR